MDDGDFAERQEQLWRDLALAAHRNRPKPAVIVLTKNCLNCGEPLPATQLTAPHRWCDADCRDDWQARQRNE